MSSGAAARVLERFYRPTILLCDLGDGTARGSCRSLPSFHLYDGLAEVGDLLDGYGGHGLAAGLTIQVQNIDAFRDALDTAAAFLSEDDLVPVLEIDAVLSAQDIHEGTICELRRLEPFGQANRPPLFCVRRASVLTRRVIPKTKHIKLKLGIGGQSFEAIGWGMAEREIGNTIDVCFSLEINEWQGKRSVQLVLRDLKRVN